MDDEKLGERLSTHLVRGLGRECPGCLSRRSIFDYLDAQKVRVFEVFFRVRLVVGVFVRVRVVTILRIVALAAVVVGFLIGLLLLQSQYLSLQGLELDDERGWRVCRLIRSFGFVGAEEDQLGSENSEI